MHVDTQSDGMSSLDDKGSMERDNSHDVVGSNVLPTSRQHNLSSSPEISDLDDDILPLFRRIHLQQKKSDSDTVTHVKTTNKKPVQHSHGTLEFPIVID